MKRPLLILIVVISFSNVMNAQTAVEGELSNPLLGTWKPCGSFDKDGNVIQRSIGKVGYDTFLENGLCFGISFRKKFPKTAGKPKTLEDYQVIGNNMSGVIQSYSVDIKNHKAVFKNEYASNPKSIGHEFTVNFKVVGDTVIYRMKNGTIHKYLRVR